VIRKTRTDISMSDAVCVGFGAKMTVAFKIYGVIDPGREIAHTANTAKQ